MPTKPLSKRQYESPLATVLRTRFFVHPPRGTHPGVLMWPDIAGMREAKKTMARRFGAEGYAVLVVNQYYRSASAPIYDKFSDWMSPEGRKKGEPMLKLLAPDAITHDAKAFIAYLDHQNVADKNRKIGTNGYCLGGGFTVRTAAAVPERVGAAVSCRGAYLVTEAADSPHRLLGRTNASFLFVVARNDDQRAPGDKEALRKSAELTARPAEIEVYPAEHGWCVLNMPLYDSVQSERAWGGLLALFGSAL